MKVLTRREGVLACLVLAAILNVLFFPALWGGKSLMLSIANAPSIVQSGSFQASPVAERRIGRTTDPGAPAWLTEPLFKIISGQYWKEHHLPLWNPYSAYGTPLAASMQPQPFYPLALLLSINPTAWTYNLFLLGRIFVAGLLMFFYARLFLSFSPSLFAGVTFMLTGYFMVFLNMPHLSVEVLLPGIFLAFELLIRKNSWTAVGAAAGTIFLSVAGGMPEALFLAGSFGFVYFIFRLAASPEFRPGSLAFLAKFTGAVVCGFGLSAFLLLPFLEFMQISHDTHQVANLTADERSGLVFDSDPRSMVTYLLPFIFGPVSNSGILGLQTGMKNYWGIIPSFLAIYALLYALRPPKHSDTRGLRHLTAFLVVCLTLMLLKRFGSPVINWIGYLPVSNMVLYGKYLEPLISFCLAMLAGIGLSFLADERKRSGYFLTAALALLGIMLALAAWSLPLVLQHTEFAKIYYLVCLAGIVLVLGIMSVLAIPARTITSRSLAWGFLCLACAELSVNFVVPSFYALNGLPPASRSPYSGAPYLDFLRSHNVDGSRVFARGGILFPNWAGVFGLADVRDLDAMYYRRYIDFIRNFLLKPGDEGRRNGDLADRFTGAETGYPYNFDTELEKRFLTLSSIKYVISPGEFGPNSGMQRIYDKEVSIYEIPRPLPRAAVFAAAEVLSQKDALLRLRDPKFNPEERVILSKESLIKADPEIVKSLTQVPAANYSAAHISFYDSQRVQIIADTNSPAVLMLNDANYPGWRAYINGHQVPVLEADYLFRGVILPTGKSVVEFSYEPLAFRLGAGVSLVTLFVLFVLAIYSTRARGWRGSHAAPAGGLTT